MGGYLEAKNRGADPPSKVAAIRFRCDSAAAPSSHRRRKEKPRHLLAVGTKSLERSAMSRRGPRGTAPMPSGRRRARHLCLGFLTRTGDASTQSGGADTAAGFPASTRGPENGCGRLKPPTFTARTGRARKSQPGGHFPHTAAAGGEPETHALPHASGPSVPEQPGSPGATAPTRVPSSGEHGPLVPQQGQISDWLPRRERDDSQPESHPRPLPALGLLSPACTVSERSCAGAAVLGNSFSFLALRFNPPELAASSNARSSPRFKGRLKPPPPPPPPPAPPLPPAPPWC